VTGCEFVVLLAEAAAGARLAAPRLCVRLRHLGARVLVLVASKLWFGARVRPGTAGAVLLSYLAARLVGWLAPPGAPIGSAPGIAECAGARPSAAVDVNA